jgi:glycosyltransferase involved in cell wall biosynthesis
MSSVAPILYVNSWSSAHGGSATSLLDIVSRLDRARFDPIVVCPEAGDLPQRLAEINVPVVIHPLSRLNRTEVWGFMKEVPWYARLLRTRNIALVHGNTSASRRSVVQAAAWRRVPYVQHVRNPVKGARAQYGYRVASRIVTNSNAVALELRADALFAHKTVTIYNAVDLARYDERDDRRRELDAEDKLVIGFVGQIVPRKGVTTLIRALPAVLQQFPTALLAIVGCPPPDESDYERECRALVDELGLSTHVRFLGYRRDIPAWMRSFDVFALPTQSEPFGKVVIEAMAAGTPVVATHVGGIPEIVTGPELGTLVAPDDPAAIAREIVRYLEDPALRARVGRVSAESVRTRFGLDAMMARLEQLYDELLDRAPVIA